MRKMTYPKVGLANATSREDFTNRLKKHYGVASDTELIVALLADRHRKLDVSPLDTALDGLLSELTPDYYPHSLKKETDDVVAAQTSKNKTLQRALRLALIDTKVIVAEVSQRNAFKIVAYDLTSKAELKVPGMSGEKLKSLRENDAKDNDASTLAKTLIEAAMHADDPYGWLLSLGYWIGNEYAAAE
jgi:hypothetical protein